MGRADSRPGPGAMVRPGRDPLSGRIEVDETYIGGEKPGKRGRGALGEPVPNSVESGWRLMVLQD